MTTNCTHTMYIAENYNSKPFVEHKCSVMVCIIVHNNIPPFPLLYTERKVSIKFYLNYKVLH